MRAHTIDSLVQTIDYADPMLARIVANARSCAEVQLAIGALRDDLGERGVLGLVNLREALIELPTLPFGSGDELSLLERVAGYRNDGGAYRKEFVSRTGAYALEFRGDGNSVEQIVVQVGEARIVLSGGEPDEVVPGELIDALFDHDTLLESLVEAVRSLGVPYVPRFHMGLEEFMLEHASESIEELSALF